MSDFWDKLTGEKKDTHSPHAHSVIYRRVIHSYYIDCARRRVPVPIVSRRTAHKHQCTPDSECSFWRDRGHNVFVCEKSLNPHFCGSRCMLADSAGVCVLTGLEIVDTRHASDVEHLSYDGMRSLNAPKTKRPKTSAAQRNPHDSITHINENVYRAIMVLASDTAVQLNAEQLRKDIREIYTILNAKKTYMSVAEYCRAYEARRAKLIRHPIPSDDKIKCLATAITVYLDTVIAPRLPQCYACEYTLAIMLFLKEGHSHRNIELFPRVPYLRDILDKKRLGQCAKITAMRITRAKRAILLVVTTLTKSGIAQNSRFPVELL